MSESDSSPALNARRVLRYALIAVAVAVAIVIWGIWSRVAERDALAKDTDAATIATVAVIHAASGPASENLVLPGNVQAYYEAPIFARTSGYVKEWKVDIGAGVKKGQLLAEIETPEVDQQLRQAQADLGTAQANYDLAKTTDERWQGLLATDSVSKQDADTRAGDAAAKKAAQSSAAANVARLQELESFKHVLAPFDGVVTLRNTDIGALINAGQAAGNALFRVSDLHRLRIYVSVPQPYAASVVAGGSADLVFAEHPNKTYVAKVTSTAQALDPATRTLQVELQVDNAKGELFPGSYAEVHFKLPASAATLRVPINTLIFHSNGMQVATVGKDNKLLLRRITEGRDFGKEVEVLSGLDPSDDIVVNPPDSATDGQAVRIAAPPPGPAKPAGAS
jgi:RND family efflux transporter MFP subunit